MKYIYNIITTIIFIIFSNYSYAESNILNIYSWGNYITREIVQQFTKETGIKINLTEYDNNETMFAKLKTTRNSDYDIVIPSNQYIERMIRKGMLHPIDKNKLTNLHNIRTFLLKKPFDYKNNFSIPYLWGTTGIIINTKYINKKDIYKWNDLWNTKYKNKIMMLNDLREVFSIALLALGYNINDTDPKHIEEAYLKLKQLLPNIKIFSVDTVPNIYVDEDAVIGMSWSGDYELAKTVNPHLEYIYPKEGFSLWIDSFVILKDAKHIDNAHKFLNFVLRPEIAQKVTSATGHANAVEIPTKEKTKNQGNSQIYLIDKIVKYGDLQVDPDDKTKKIYEKYWEKLKIGD